MTFADLCEQFKDACTLSAEDERVLIRRAQDGDPEATDKLVFLNMKLVISRALLFCKPKDPRILDLISDGSLGLLVAIKRFNLDMPFRFSTYAVWWINSFIRKGLRFFKKGQLGPIENLKTEFAKGYKMLSIVAGKAPTDEEVAKYLNWPNYVFRIYQKYSTERTKSIHGVECTLSIKERGVVESVIHSENKDVLAAVLRKLTAVEEDVIRRRYGIGCKEETLVKIASFYQLARERIRQIEARALRKIFILLTDKVKAEEPQEPEIEDEATKKKRRAKVRVTQAMKKIDPVERDVVARYYGIGRAKETAEDIAKTYGSDVSKVMEILDKAHASIERVIGELDA